MSTRKGWLVASARYSIYSFLSCPEADGHPHNNHLITRSLWGKNKQKKKKKRLYAGGKMCLPSLHTPPPWTVLLVITQKEGWWWLVGKPGSSTAPGVGNRYTTASRSLWRGSSRRSCKGRSSPFVRRGGLAFGRSAPAVVAAPLL